MGTEDIDIARYTSREWHELEKEKVWSKTWQVACRVEDIPEVGDHILYDVCDDSVIVVRTPTRHHQGLRQRLPAQRQCAVHRTGARKRIPLPLPRLDMVAGRSSEDPARCLGFLSM